MIDTKTIAIVNKVDIIATVDDQYISLKSLCEAIGCDYDLGVRMLLESFEEENYKGEGIDDEGNLIYWVYFSYAFGWLGRMCTFPDNTARVNCCFSAIHKYWNTSMVLKDEILDITIERSQLISDIHGMEERIVSLNRRRTYSENRLKNLIIDE